MTNSIFELLRQDCLFRTKRLSIYSWNAIEKSTKSKEQLYEDVLKIMTPNVTKDLPDGWQNLDSQQEAERWVEERMNDNHFYVIQPKENKKMIGFLFLYTENETSDAIDLRLGYLLAEPTWGKGMGSELIKGLIDWCEEDKRVKSISGGVEANNVGSIRVLEKNGFVKTNDGLPGNMLLYKRGISNKLG